MVSQSLKKGAEENIIDELLFDLQAESPERRLQAFKDLIDYRENESVRLELRKHCFRESNPKVRHFALGWFDRLTPSYTCSDSDVKSAKTAAADNKVSPAALKNLEKRLAMLEDPAEKIRALRQSRLRSSKEIIGVLATAIKPTSDPIYLAYAISLFTKTPVQVYAPLITRFLRHANQRVRANAIEALAAMRPANLGGTLAKFLDDPDNRIRANAVLAVYQADPENARKALQRMADSPEECYRDSAVYCLSQLPARGNINILIRMFGRETVKDLSVKQAHILLPLLQEKNSALLADIVAANPGEQVEAVLTKLGISVPDELIYGSGTVGRWRRSFFRKLQATGKLLAMGFSALRERPMAQLATLVLISALLLFTFARTGIKRRFDYYSETIGRSSLPRIRAAAPEGLKRVISIKGRVHQTGDSWVLVKTRSALYQISFADGLPAGCDPDAIIEASGFYDGYDYASATILLASLKFRSTSQTRPQSGG